MTIFLSIISIIFILLGALVLRNTIAMTKKEFYMGDEIDIGLGIAGIFFCVALLIIGLILPW